MSRAVRSLRALLFAVFALGGDAARAGDALTAVAECPNAGRNRACLLMQFYADTPQHAEAVRTVAKPDGSVEQFIALIGRVDGAPLAKHVLRVRHPNPEFAFDTDIGPLAYIGRSSRDRPIILTNKGRLEITSAHIDLAKDVALAIYNNKTKMITARYFRPFAMPFVAVAPDIVGVWDRKRRLCVSAAQRKPGQFTLMTSQCRRATRGKRDEFELISGRITPAPEDPLRALDLARLSSGGELGHEAMLFTLANTDITLILVLAPLSDP